MSAQLGRLWECLVTLVAFKWFLARVCSNVIVQCRGASEWAPAKTAFKWLLVDVNDNMLSELGWAWERCRTVAALVWTIRGLKPIKQFKVSTGNPHDWKRIFSLISMEVQNGKLKSRTTTIHKNLASITLYPIKEVKKFYYYLWQANRLRWACFHSFSSDWALLTLPSNLDVHQRYQAYRYESQWYLIALLAIFFEKCQRCATFDVNPAPFDTSQWFGKDGLQFTIFIFVKFLGILLSECLESHHIPEGHFNKESPCLKKQLILWCLFGHPL